MKRLLTKAWIVFNLLSLIYILATDFLFTIYLNNKPLTYAQFDSYRIALDNISFILLVPVSLFVWKLLKFNSWPARKLSVAYALFGLLSPCLFLLSFTARYGQISWEYSSFSSTVLPNLGFKVMILALLFLIVWPILIHLLSIAKFHTRHQLKSLFVTLGMSIGSAVIFLIVLVILSWKLLSLLDKILLSNKINESLPVLEGYKNQKIVITDYPDPLLKCYLSENPQDAMARLLRATAGSSFFNKLGYNSYYLNNDCFVVYIGQDLQFKNQTTINQAAIMSELLIRTAFGNYQKFNSAVHPSQIISIESKEFPEDYRGGNLGSYNSDSNSITISKGYNYTFEVIIHEELHAFARSYESWLGYERSGIHEAVTQYLVGKILRNMTFEYTSSFYQPQLEAFGKLIPFVDEELLINAYFDGNLQSLETEVDNKTYKGAYCRFNDYLDRSIVEWVDTKNFDLAKEFAKKAVAALTSKQTDPTSRCKF